MLGVGHIGEDIGGLEGEWGEIYFILCVYEILKN